MFEKIGGPLVLASVSSSQYLKAMLIDLIKTARTLDQQFGGSHEADVLKDFKSEISRFLGDKIPSKTNRIYTKKERFLSVKQT